MSNTTSLSREKRIEAAKRITPRNLIQEREGLAVGDLIIVNADMFALMQEDAAAQRAEIQRLTEENIVLTGDLETAKRERAKQSAWQPIETTPKDTKSRLVWCPGNRCTFAVTWLDGNPFPGWIIFGGNGSYLREKPTHWKPMPEPPAAAMSATQEGKDLLPALANLPPLP